MITFSRAKGRKARSRCFAFLSLATAVLFMPGALRAEEATPARPPEAPVEKLKERPKEKAVSLSPADASALMQLIRSRAGPPGAIPAPDPIPAPLNESLDAPLIVVLHGMGASAQREATRPTLKESAEAIADEFAQFIGHAPQGAQLLSGGRLEADVVTRRQLLADVSSLRYLQYGQGIGPGLEGVAYTVKGRTAWFTPITLLLHRRVLNPLVYQTPGAGEPPPVAERFLVQSFVEEKPGGPALPLYRGNVLVPSPNGDDMVQAVFHAGLWFLRTQREDGAFLWKYDPAEETEDKEYNLPDHLRATAALTVLQQLSGDPRFAQARDRAIAYACNPRNLREERREGFVCAPISNDEITASALLLTALASASLGEPDPAATGLMKQLGEFLCFMTADDGHLYSRLSLARAKKQPYATKGSAYAETLLALSLLQRVSPTDRVRQAATRIGNLLSSGPGDVLLTSDVRTMARTVEALAECYRLTRTDGHAAAALRLAERIAQPQISTEKAPYEDYAGGFCIVEMTPDTLSTAAATCAFASAGEIARQTGQPTGRFSTAARNAAWFLINMQYRPANSFFLDEPELALGAFRRDPESPTVHLAATAEATRGLFGAAAVSAEPASPASPAEIKPPER